MLYEAHVPCANEMTTLMHMQLRSGSVQDTSTSFIHSNLRNPLFLVLSTKMSGAIGWVGGGGGGGGGGVTFKSIKVCGRRCGPLFLPL